MQWKDPLTAEGQASRWWNGLVQGLASCSHHHSSWQFSVPRDICCLLGLGVVSFCCLLLQERIQNPSIWRIFKLKFGCMALVPWYIRLWNSPSVQHKKAGWTKCPLFCGFVHLPNHPRTVPSPPTLFRPLEVTQPHLFRQWALIIVGIWQH